MKIKNIAIFASGSGSNAENIVDYFRDNPSVNISLFLTNNPKAYVKERAKKLQIPIVEFSREQFYGSEEILNILKTHSIDLIVLAGFLWLVPDNLIRAFPNQIINIHPALLPKYGGKGMYGNRVHEAVKKAGDYETGITIHYVNAQYDQGKIIFQTTCSLDDSDTPQSIAEKVHDLEYKYFPKVIENLLIS